MIQPTLLRIRSEGLANSIIRLNSLLENINANVSIRVMVNPTLKIRKCDTAIYAQLRPRGDSLTVPICTLPSQYVTNHQGELAQQIIDWAYSANRGSVFAMRIRALLGPPP